eukprot:9829681-Lingulodinium_polyedra.AAC.1
MLGPEVRSAGLTKMGVYFARQIHLAAGPGACQHCSRGQGGATEQPPGCALISKNGPLPLTLGAVAG